MSDIAKKLVEFMNSNISNSKIENQLVIEFESKLKMYDDPVYNYLKKIGYDSPDYIHKGISKRVDDLLSSWCNFKQNRHQEILLLEALRRIKKTSGINK